MGLTRTVAEIVPGDHAFAVLDSDEQHWEVAAGYVGAGLARREKVVYLDGERTAAPLLRRLRELGVDAGAALRSGQLVVMPRESLLGVWDGSLEQVRGQLRRSIDAALAEGYPGVRMSDEPAADGPVRAGELDALLHQVIDGRPVTMLCLYERRHWSAADLDGLGRRHPVEVVAPALYDDGLLRITREAPYRTRISGEIDYSNRDTVRAMIEDELDRLLRTGAEPQAGDTAGEIALHLDSLRFADVTAVSRFVQVADAFPRSHRLVLCGVQPTVRRLLDRCGAPLRSQLTVAEAPEAAGAPEARGVPQQREPR